jgi:ubiquinone/menaquinone biosynthesis C-methylase UbiE
MSGPASVSTSVSTSDKVFAGSVPKVYEQYLVPLIFEPYAQDLARRLARRPCERVLEIAAGTGAVTRQLASVLPQHVSIVATDLNRPMLDLAAAIGTMRPVEWREADAMQLPFDEEASMRSCASSASCSSRTNPRHSAEARRVLKPAGHCCSTSGIGSRRTSSRTW